MAPQQPTGPVYQKNEKALCFHGAILYNCRILDARPASPQLEGSPPQFEYKVHYDQWKTKWDSWVSLDRLRKLTPENVAERERLEAQLNPPKSAKSTTKNSSKRKSGLGGEATSVADSDDRTPAPATARTQKRARENGIENEEAFMGRRTVRVTLPDHLKSILVDDWEFVSKDQKIVPLPSSTPVRAILQDYYEGERSRRTPGSVKYDLVPEMRDGLLDYFERCLGKFLLYKVERTQYSDIVKMLAKDEDQKHKTVADIYGAEHLARTLTTLPLDIAESNLDRQSVDALRDELQHFAIWLSKNSNTYFINAYENAPTEHVEKARNGA